METAIVAAVTAVIGFLSGLIVPWIRWRIERKRELLAHRRRLITLWRTTIGGHNFNSPEERSDFGSSTAYSSLRPLMRPEIVEKFEAARTFYVGGGRGEDVRTQMLLDEVARIERMWDLI